MEIMGKFTPIAMRCTQEQFDAVRSKIEKEGINFGSVRLNEDFPYLINHHAGDDSLEIGNYRPTDATVYTYETWNEKVFLEACGAEVDNPKTKTLFLKQESGENYIIFNDVKYIPEPEFHITKQQIWDIDNFGYSKVREWYPEAFEEDAVELEVGKWYKMYFDSMSFLACIKENSKTESIAYGFDENKNYESNLTFQNDYNYNPVLAIRQEVEEALKDECIRIGIKLGSAISRDFDDKLNNVIIDIKSYRYDSEWRYDSKDDYLEHHGFVVYSKGQFAKVIPTKTRQEAEKELNCKIVD